MSEAIDTPVRRSTPRTCSLRSTTLSSSSESVCSWSPSRRFGAGAEADGGDLVGLGGDGAGLARLGLVDRGGHDDAGAVTLDRAVGRELEARAAGIFQQRAQNFVAALEIGGGAVELAGALFELGLGGGGLGAGFVEPAIVFGAFALDFGVGGRRLRAFEQRVGGRVDAPASEAHGAQRQQGLLARRQEKRSGRCRRYDDKSAVPGTCDRKTTAPAIRTGSWSATAH